MPSITATLRSLGNDGAISNARTVLHQQRQEIWLVASLAHRLEQRERTTADAGIESATTAA